MTNYALPLKVNGMSDEQRRDFLIWMSCFQPHALRAALRDWEDNGPADMNTTGGALYAGVMQHIDDLHTAARVRDVEQWAREQREPDDRRLPPHSLNDHDGVCVVDCAHRIALNSLRRDLAAAEQPVATAEQWAALKADDVRNVMRG